MEKTQKEKYEDAIRLLATERADLRKLMRANDEALTVKQAGKKLQRAILRTMDAVLSLGALNIEDLLNLQEQIHDLGEIYDIVGSADEAVNGAYGVLVILDYIDTLAAEGVELPTEVAEAIEPLRTYYGDIIASLEASDDEEEEEPGDDEADGEESHNDEEAE